MPVSDVGEAQLPLPLPPNEWQRERWPACDPRALPMPQVPSKRHARMLTGRSGGALAAIARNAVPHIEKVVGCRVRLGLHVAIKNRMTPEA